jgi:hypothetical protein
MLEGRGGPTGTAVLLRWQRAPHPQGAPERGQREKEFIGVSERARELIKKDMLLHKRLEEGYSKTDKVKEKGNGLRSLFFGDGGAGQEGVVSTTDSG